MCGIIIIVLSSLEMSLEISSATVCERLCWLNTFDLFISLPLKAVITFPFKKNLFSFTGQTGHTVVVGD